MKTIAFFTQKGGAGKTTAGTNVAHMIATVHNKKAIAIDNDPQTNLTKAMGCESEDYTTIDLYTTQKDGPKETPYQNLTIIPAHEELIELEEMLIEDQNRLFIMKEAVERLKQKHNPDYIIIDSPPHIGVLSLNALVAADLIIVPYDCSYFATQGLKSIIEKFESIRDNINPNIQLKILITKFDQKNKSDHNAEKELREVFGEMVYKTKIRLSNTIKSAQNQNRPIGAYTQRFNGYLDYLELTKEILQDE